MLVQNADDQFSDDIKLMTETAPTEEQRKALLFLKELLNM
jgi:phosphoribosylaminoimidazolecarboxamide formyltransferase/IMP cyclohydrolase